MKRSYPFVLGASFVLFAQLLAGAAGCAEERTCTPSDPSFDIEMTREVAATSAGGTLLVEACLGATCEGRSPAPSGELSFGAGLSSYEGGPTRGSVGLGAAPGTMRITVIYLVREGSDENVSLVVRQRDATLLDESTTVRWASVGDPCHVEPVSTTL